VLEDGRQILVALPRGLPGVRIDPTLDLMALRGSCTTQVHCRNVCVDRHWLLAGPAERVITGEATGGLATSCLALGLAAAATGYLGREAQSRPELTSVAERLEGHRHKLWEMLLQQAQGDANPNDANRLRAAANLCVLQTTQAALTASKGTGFVHPHPAQRWARQALFFLVWSCPRPTAEVMFECLAGE
jgi:alkylation response protein AidB-like acyl-CoA dehydrogenase